MNFNINNELKSNYTHKCVQYMIIYGKFDSEVFFFLQIEALDVGQIVKVRIGHDGKKFMSGWHLNKVFKDITFFLRNQRETIQHDPLGYFPHLASVIIISIC